MYTEYFKLSRKAFSKTPDPDFFFETPEFTEALAQLQYAAEERELAVLTGDVGTGKTMLTRALVDSLDEDEYDFVVITNPRLTPNQLIRSIAADLGLEQLPRYKADITAAIADKLLDLFERGKSALIIIDEAHLIPKKACFDELRLLTNFQLDADNLLALLLVGQPELETRLAHKAYRPLRQRIGAEYHLVGLNDPETVYEYIRHRLRKAGANNGKLFTLDAAQVIFEKTKGIPRVINNLCTQCLLEAMAKSKKSIDGKTAEKVANSLRFLG